MTPADIRTQADMHYQHPVLAPLLRACADVVEQGNHITKCDMQTCHDKFAEALARLEALKP